MGERERKKKSTISALCFASVTTMKACFSVDIGNSESSLQASKCQQPTEALTVARKIVGCRSAMSRFFCVFWTLHYVFDVRQANKHLLTLYDNFCLTIIIVSLWNAAKRLIWITQQARLNLEHTDKIVVCHEFAVVLLTSTADRKKITTAVNQSQERFSRFHWLTFVHLCILRESSFP